MNSYSRNWNTPDFHSWWISKMQSGRQDTLEEQYAIELCFKLGKNGTETYEMLQTAFGASCMNRASVFEWHKRFKEARESVRDDERCGRSKEVRTPELIGQIKNFMDKDRRVSIEIISALFDVSVGRCGRFARSLSQVCSEKIRKKDIVMTAGRWSSWSIQILQFLMLWWPPMKAGYTAMTQRPRDRVPSHAGFPKPKNARQSKSTHKLLMILFFYSISMIYMHWVPTGQTVNKEYYIEILREFSSNLVSGISSRTMHQSTTPSLSQTIWPKWASRGFVTLPIVQTLPPVTFGYSLISRKGCDEGHWYAHTRGHPWGLPKVVGTVQHCCRGRLLRRGLEFHVCTINKSAHTKKSLETYCCLLIYIYIYICVCYVCDCKKKRQRYCYIIYGWYLFFK